MGKEVLEEGVRVDLRDLPPRKGRKAVDTIEIEESVRIGLS